MSTNRQNFTQHLITAYLDLFKTDPDYYYVHSRMGAEVLAEKMVKALAVGDAHLVGKGIARACKAAGIKKTRQAIIKHLAE